MFSLRLPFFSHQHAPAADPVAELEPAAPSIVRENFTWDTDSMTVEQIVDQLRQHTINFSFRNVTTWAITDLDYKGVEIRCKLTENQDIVWAVNGEQVFHPRAVINMVKEFAVQF